MSRRQTSNNNTHLLAQVFEHAQYFSQKFFSLNEVVRANGNQRYEVGAQTKASAREPPANRCLPVAGAAIPGARPDAAAWHIFAPQLMLLVIQPFLQNARVLLPDRHCCFAILHSAKGWQNAQDVH